MPVPMIEEIVESFTIVANFCARGRFKKAVNESGKTGKTEQ